MRSQGRVARGRARVDIDRAAHHDLPHDDAVGVDVGHLVQAVVPLDLRRDVEWSALLDIALVAPVTLHARGHAKINDLRLCGIRPQRHIYALECRHLILQA